MAVLHSLLAVYAAFDRSVVEANNPEWSRLVESFLPGTTGENQRGWSNDVEQWVRRLSPNPPDPQQMQLQHALADLNEAAIHLTARAYGDQPEEDAEPPLVSVTHISQLLYAIAVGRTLAYRAPATSVDFSLFADDSEMEGLSPILGLAGDPLENIFRIPADPPTSDAPPSSEPFDPQTAPPRITRIAAFKSLLDSEELADRTSWPRVMTLALQGQPPLVSELVATASPITFVGTVRSAETPVGAATAAAAVAEIDGNFCAVLTTDCWRKATGLTVQKVKDIVEPLNWPSLNPFFCKMDKRPPDSRRASQTLEHVSTDEDVYQLKTALKYWKRDFDGGAIVNYELADDRAGTGDSMLTLVDSGYIHILDNGADSVRIRTSKMVAIEGGSVTATAIFIQMLGWAAMGDSMYFDNALKPPAVKFLPWSTNPEQLTGESAANAQAAANAQVAAPQPTPLPVGVGGLLIRESARSWASYVKETTKSTQAVVDKWSNGKLTIQDMTTYAAEMGGRLASEPWRIVAELSGRIPTTPPPPTNTPPDPNAGGYP